MSSVLRKIRSLSLRAKLLFWYSLVFTGCGVALVALNYSFAAGELKSEADKFLKDETEEFVRQAEARLPDVAALEAYLELEIGKGRWFVPFYRMADASDGQVLLFMPPDAPRTPLTDLALSQAQRRAELAETLRSSDPPHTVYRVRTAFMDLDRRTLALQCGFVFGKLYARLQRLRMYLAFSIVATMAAAIGGGFLLSARSLRPMAEMIQNLRDIRGSDLSRRLPQREVRDEVGQLSSAVNQMLQELETAFGYMRSFTGEVAHELRTWLATIRCEVEVAVAQERSAEEYRLGLGLVLDRIKSLSDTVENMLLLAKVDSSAVPPAREPVDLGQLVANLVEMFEILAETKGVTVTVQAEPSLWVSANSQWLRVAFGNLMDNAIKYTPSGGHVSVAAKRANGDIMVSVSDTGPGIPREQWDRIFERFYRGDEGRKAGPGGAGLGLSIAKRVIELHDGRISVNSRPGQETVFAVRLPACGDRPRHERPDPS